MSPDITGGWVVAALDREERERRAWAIGAALAFVVAIVVGVLLAGCVGPKAQANTVADVANKAGPALAAWAARGVDCTGLDEDTCVETIRAKNPELWNAWDAFAAAHAAYAEALELGGAPSRAAVDEAYCKVLAVLPRDAPRELVVLGACERGTP